jgi:hypothetical protein
MIGCFEEFENPTVFEIIDIRFATLADRIYRIEFNPFLIEIDIQDDTPML